MCTRKQLTESRTSNEAWPKLENNNITKAIMQNEFGAMERISAHGRIAPLLEKY